MPSYVSSIQERGIGASCQKDSIIDKPLITIYLASSDLNQIKDDIRILNQEIEAYDEKEQPLLMRRFNPENLR